MIIWGSRGSEKTVGNGTFYCPRCAGESTFEHIDVRQYFTIYFIPLIPMGSAGEYIKCQSCAGTYAMDILSYDPEAEKAQIAETLRRVCILFLVDVKRHQPNELLELCDVVGDLVNLDIEPEDVALDVQNAEASSTDLLTYVKRELSDFSEEGKWIVLVAIRQILEKTSGILPTERSRIVDVGKAMGLRRKHIDQFMDAPMDVEE